MQDFSHKLQHMRVFANNDKRSAHQLPHFDKYAVCANVPCGDNRHKPPVWRFCYTQLRLRDVLPLVQSGKRGRVETRSRGMRDKVIHKQNAKPRT
jgi:hypothetical protein